jgi:hypothetical protein
LRAISSDAASKGKGIDVKLETARRSHYLWPMSTVDLICEKARALPDSLQSEALSFVEYLSRRGTAPNEAAEWQRLSRQTQALSAVERITDADIAAEIAAYRAGR